MTSRLKILFLSQRFLFPMDTGGKIRTGNILQRLSRHHDITLVGNFDPDSDKKYLEEMETVCSRFVPVNWSEPPRGSIRYYLRLLRNVFSRYPVTAMNDYSPELEAAILKEVDENTYDIAVCDFVQSALIFQQLKGVPTLLFTHNVEARICARHVEGASNVFSKYLWKDQQRKMEAFEEASIGAFDKVIAVSENDQNIFQQDYKANNAVKISTGVDLDFYRPNPEQSKDSNDIVFCGSMDWLPNEDAMIFFMNDIAQHLDQLGSPWSLTIVGRNPSEKMRQTVAERSNVNLTGWVDDVRPYLESAALCIVPIRIGGGTRMKIYEAMAMGKAVISTTIGAEGLDYQSGKDIIVVDQAEDFAKEISELLTNVPLRAEIGHNARVLVEERFGWEVVAQEFADHCFAVADKRNDADVAGETPALAATG